MPRVLTSSMISSLLACPYKGALEYLGWQTNEAKPALDFGTRWHNWIEQTIKTGKPDFINCGDLPVASLKSWFYQAQENDVFELDFEPEVEAIKQIHANLWVACKADARSTKTGQLMEHKTSSYVSNGYFLEKSVEPQPLIYAAVFNTKEILWDVYNKKTGEVRFEWIRNLKTEDSLQLILHADDLLIKGLQGLKVRGESCFHFFNKYCPYHPLCFNDDQANVHQGEFNRFSQYSEEMRAFILELVNNVLNS